MSTIAKEWLQQKIADMEAARDETPFGLDEDDSNTLAALRIALASLEAEPVCVIDQSNLDYLKSGSDADVWPASRTEMGDVLLYRAAPPAPVSVPDEDLLHMAASAIEDLLSNKDRYCAGVWADIPAKLRRAAMLQGSDRPQNEPQNIPENIPATQFKPVADLYGLTSPTGGETSFTFDAVEARDFIDGGWSCQEYVELERFQEAVSGNSPVIPDGWVACVERMPSAGEQVLAYRPDAPESNDPLIKMATYVGGSAHGHGFDCYCKPTHWMPLPAAPQQEVK
ncbi:DUF551 domain-containing protein [Enterobacter asburiae]|uniref:DUF551 domain-containing protein n=1 Tax=Enterobacter asburiae TaxID=61645 RepID=UPI002FE512ED